MAADTDTEPEADEHTEPPSDAQLRDTIREVVLELLGETDEPEPETTDGGTDDPPSGPATNTVAGSEAHMEEVVRRAMDRLRRDEDTDRRVTELEKKVTEAAPREVRRLTSILWGDTEKKK